ncbi:hypothetical protein ACFE04_000886 [Oxalis oulophora]
MRATGRGDPNFSQRRRKEGKTYVFILMSRVVTCNHGRSCVTGLTSNCHILRIAEYLASGRVNGPKDFVYDNNTGILYTGVEDGWIKKVYVNTSKNSKTRVENWVNTGGRPLGLARGLNNELIVADAYKGLLNVSRDGTIRLLTNTANGLKFNLTNSAEVASNGVIYFTDSSYKYSLQDVELAVLDPRPYGRFMSYDPRTRKTKVLRSDLYVPGGVVVSQPDQNSVIFCEYIALKCTRYYTRTANRGRTEIFIDNLPTYPSDIKYDRQGPNYWISLVPSNMTSYYGGALATTLDGKPIAQYSDFNATCSSATRLGDYFYCVSTIFTSILTFNWRNQNLPSRTCNSPICSRKCN